tara:strand:+ start:1147 stop:1278 length:132 start_codon:yes stop_codon:yes gene_type:complete
MSEDKKGLKIYDNLDLSKSKNEDELLGVYKDGLHSMIKIMMIY